jgi:hypothetical protein
VTDDDAASELAIPFENADASECFPVGFGARAVVGDAKRKIAQRFAVPIDRIKIVCNGRVLRDGMAMAQFLGGKPLLFHIKTVEAVPVRTAAGKRADPELALRVLRHQRPSLRFLVRDNVRIGDFKADVAKRTGLRLENFHLLGTQGLLDKDLTVGAAGVKDGDSLLVFPTRQFPDVTDEIDDWEEQLFQCITLQELQLIRQTPTTEIPDLHLAVMFLRAGKDFTRFADALCIYEMESRKKEQR